jgi:hypothetical protein
MNRPCRSLQSSTVNEMELAQTYAYPQAAR